MTYEAKPNIMINRSRWAVRFMMILEHVGVDGVILLKLQCLLKVSPYNTLACICMMVHRWLVEYGFLMDDGKPERLCHSWNLTAMEVVAGQAAILGSRASLKALSATSHQRLRQKGMQQWVMVRLDGSGAVHASMVQWLSVVVGAPPDGLPIARVQGVEKQEAYALGILCRLIKEQQARLEKAVREAKEALLKPSSLGEPQGIREHQSMLLELAHGSFEATRFTMDRLNAFC